MREAAIYLRELALEYAEKAAALADYPAGRSLNEVLITQHAELAAYRALNEAADVLEYRVGGEEQEHASTPSTQP